jgi:hypothetical protein
MSTTTHGTARRTTPQPPCDLHTWLHQLDVEAQRTHDGHYTILAFTTGYKVAFGTPELYAGWGYDRVLQMPSYSDLAEAIREAILHHICFLHDRLSVSQEVSR